jgi:hypothetical protein
MAPMSSQSGQSPTNEGVARARRPIEPAWSPGARLASSNAAYRFGVAGVLTATLALTAAALLYHGSTSNSMVAIALACLAGAVLVQFVARRRLRGELADEALRRGADDPQNEARARLERWLEQP